MLYCKNCDNDTRFGLYETADYAVDKDGNLTCTLEEHGHYYCQICKEEVKDVE